LDIFLIVVAIAFLVYIFYGFYLYFRQRDLLYHPMKQTNHDNLVEENFELQGCEIKVSILNKESTKAIIYFGGNKENVDKNVETFSEIFPDHSVYLIKYRGYAGSTCGPSEKAIYFDAAHIFEEIKENHKEILIIGRSLGSGVATYIATQKKIDKLILVTPFDSIQNVIQSKFPLYPIGWMLKDRYDSLSRVKKIMAPTLIIAAQNDDVVGMIQTKRLLHAFLNKPKFVIIQGVNHSSIITNPSYYDALHKFIYN
jgi:pimeloyl-ACP methyl ester carboxylesterase